MRDTQNTPALCEEHMKSKMGFSSYQNKRLKLKKTMEIFITAQEKDQLYGGQ